MSISTIVILGIIGIYMYQFSYPLYGTNMDNVDIPNTEWGWYIDID